MYLLDMLQEDEGRMAVSYVEVYNEAVYDLLGSQERRLPVRWTDNRGFHVAGAKHVSCRDMDAVNMVQSLTPCGVLMLCQR